MERTLAILKPEVLIDKQENEIIAIIEASGFKIIRKKVLNLTLHQAAELYKEHQDKSFFDGLTHYMTSSEILALILEKGNAVVEFRSLIGSSNLSKNGPGTLRYKFAKNERENAVHGSDSIVSAIYEINVIWSN